MIGPELGKAAFGWAMFIVLLGALLLWVTEPGSAGFVISAVMVGLGVLFAGVVFAMVRFLGR